MTLQIFLLQVLAVLVTAFLIPRFQVHGPFSGAILVGALTLLNTTLWDPSLFQFIPDTLGVRPLTIIFANGIIIWILAKLLPGVESQGILPALAFPIVLSIVSYGIQRHCKDIPWEELSKKGIQIVQSIRTELKKQE